MSFSFALASPTANDLEKYISNGDDISYIEKANKWGKNAVLDINDGITIYRTILYNGKTKKELFEILKDWSKDNLNGENKIICYNENDFTVIYNRLLIEDVARYSKKNKTYSIALRPYVLLSIKDGYIRVKVEIDNYYVQNLNKIDDETKYTKKMNINKGYPFKLKKDNMEATSKAFVFSSIIADYLKDSIIDKIIETEI